MESVTDLEQLSVFRASFLNNPPNPPSYPHVHTCHFTIFVMSFTHILMSFLSFCTVSELAFELHNFITSTNLLPYFIFQKKLLMQLQISFLHKELFLFFYILVLNACPSVSKYRLFCAFLNPFRLPAAFDKFLRLHSKAQK